MLGAFGRCGSICDQRNLAGASGFCPSQYELHHSQSALANSTLRSLALSVSGMALENGQRAGRGEAVPAMQW